MIWANPGPARSIGRVSSGWSPRFPWGMSGWCWARRCRAWHDRGRTGIQRRLPHGGGQHDAIGVYDRITWDFIRYIAGYRKADGPRVRQLIADHARDARVVVLRSRREARRCLAGVAVSGSATVPAVAVSEERNDR